MHRLTLSRSREQGNELSLGAILKLLGDDPEWSDLAHTIASSTEVQRSVHLAVFVEPFLDFVLCGRKTIESRFSAVRIPPYGRVARGDLILLKRSGGPVVGVCEIGAAWFYKLDPESWKTIRQEFTRAICAEDPEFWRDREGAEFATLMHVVRAKRLPPIPWTKRDRRGWVVVRAGSPGQNHGGLVKRTVLGFAGGIASGKSTLSEAVAQSLGCSRVSFGGFIRSEALRRGLGTDRRSLQTIGEELVAKDPDGLCQGVLSQALWHPGGALVVDGIRHVEIAQRLRQLVNPSEFRLVYVSTPEATRAQRLASRGENSQQLSEYELHSTEQDVRRSLPEVANLVLDGERPIEVLIEDVMKWAESFA